MEIAKKYYNSPIGDYETEEDREHFKNIYERFESSKYEELTEREQLELDGELHDLEADIITRYIKGCNNDANIILQDIYKAIDSITTTEYENYLIAQKNRLELFIHAQEMTASLQLKETIKEKSQDTISKELEDQRKNSTRGFYSFYRNAFFNIGDLYTALELWSGLKLDIPPIAPLDMEINEGQAYKIKDWHIIDDNIKDYVFKRYIALYPDVTEKPDDTAIIKAHQAILHQRSINTLNYPIDKPNSELWSVINTEQSGQLRFAFETGKRGDNTATVLCSVNWDDPNTKITKHLTEWDKRVYIATASLFDGGNETVTINQIHKLMGNDSDPNDKQKAKINESLTKMGTARLYIDNQGEIDANYNYPPFKYDAPLLPFERMTAKLNGIETTAIHLLKEPPLIAFAKGRKQITTIPLGLLKSPISKTEDNLRLEDYLIDRISHMRKNEKLSRKILFSKICEKCNITQKKQRQRLTPKIIKYLEHYITHDFIKDYEIDQDKNITITL